MKQTSSNAGLRLLSPLRKEGVDGRIFRSMAVVTVVAVLASLGFASWRFTTGLALGGLLALLNHHWLTSSTQAAMSVVAYGAKPKIRLITYVLRYAVIGVIVFVAYNLGVASLPAMIVGLCSFVPALFIEAAREFYLAIIHREEVS